MTNKGLDSELFEIMIFDLPLSTPHPPLPANYQLKRNVGDV